MAIELGKRSLLFGRYPSSMGPEMIKRGPMIWPSAISLRHSKRTAALSSFFVDESLLDRVRFFRCAEAFQGRNLVLADRTHRRDTRAHCPPAQDNRAGSALGHSAPELRATQPKFVAQDVQQWCCPVDVDRFHAAINSEGNLAHSNPL